MVYRKHFGTTPAEVTFAGESHDVDITAALADDGKVLTLGIVNPNPEPVAIDLAYEGADIGSQAELWLVAGDDPQAYNEVDTPRVDVEHRTESLGRSWTAPGYSFAVIRLPME
jgi:alpha-L-arabinofuranosidase